LSYLTVAIYLDAKGNIYDRFDAYDILNVSRLSTKQVIGKAYRKLMIKWHPSKNKN